MSFIGGLPGDTKAIDSNEQCDNCENTVTKRVQGETDSFGAEYHYVCDDCAAKMKQEDEEYRNILTSCDWCKKEAKLHTARDFEEGLSGPVYEICDDCASKQNRALREEFDAEEYWEQF